MDYKLNRSFSHHNTLKTIHRGMLKEDNLVKVTYRCKGMYSVYRSTSLFEVLLSIIPIAHYKLWSKNIKWKIPEESFKLQVE